MTPHEQGLAAARAYAGWHLGYMPWADAIIGAYLYPERALEQLAREKGNDE